MVPCCKKCNKGRDSVPLKNRQQEKQEPLAGEPLAVYGPALRDAPLLFQELSCSQQVFQSAIEK